MDKNDLGSSIVNSTIEQHPDLKRVNGGKMLNLANDCLAEIEKIDIPTIKHNSLPKIDVVWIISAPGLLLKRGAKPGWSNKFKWMNNFEHKVVKRGVDYAVKMKRLSGIQPWIIYNGTPNECKDFQYYVTKRADVDKNKVYIFDKITEIENTRDIKNTTDQANSIHFPHTMKPRGIVISILAVQWIRLGRILAKSQTIDPKTKIYILPTLTLRNHLAEHATMEIRGTLVNCFKLHNAKKSPIDYRIVN